MLATTLTTSTRIQPLAPTAPLFKFNSFLRRRIATLPIPTWDINRSASSVLNLNNTHLPSPSPPPPPPSLGLKSNLNPQKPKKPRLVLQKLDSEHSQLAQPNPVFPVLNTKDKDIRIVQCTSLATLSKTLALCSGPIIALDCEWKIVMRKGAPQPMISLIQIFNGSCVGLFRVHLLGPPFPHLLCALLEDPDIIKVGLNIRGDVGKIWRDFGIKTSAYVELMQYAKTHTGFIKKPSLNELTQSLLGLSLDKAMGGVRTGNWEAVNLSPTQIEYAAADVVASWEVYWAIRKLSSYPQKLETYVPKRKRKTKA
ncbi:ribonuclease H-like protein, partial [Rhizoclosmatium globosum]